MNNFDNAFIYGKNFKKNVVALEVKDSACELFIRENGKIKVEVLPNEYWILYAHDYSGSFTRLKGEQHYGYGDKFDNYDEYRGAIQEARSYRWDYFTVHNEQEMFMQKNGVTLFKGMMPEDLSVLSFDIETTGTTHDETSKVLLISNTFKRGDTVVRRLFSYDQYKTQKQLIKAWADFVREVDPDVMVGHNIFGFDLPYMRYCGGDFNIGRDGSRAKFERYVSQFRKDGSQAYDYNNVRVYGRQIVDTFHLSIKYDIGRNYKTYKLKDIIRHEKLERGDRQHYDASQIRFNYQDAFEWAKIKEYAEHDADDALALWELMIPSYFYFTQSIPKTLQQIISGASGSQVNSFMIRSYLQNGYGLPKGSDQASYEGGISYGNPGIYKNVNKVDVASLYPSIMLKNKIYDKVKDPLGNFYEMVSHFTAERLKNKALAKTTGDRYFKDLEQSQKIIINSAYGFLGAPRLNFNSPELAAEVTTEGRNILLQGVQWAESRGYQIVNADTDSFSYTTGYNLSPTEFKVHIIDLNRLFDPLIYWEDDGQYDTVVVVKAKNYVLYNDGKFKIKGSALKATMKEPALKKFIDEILMLFINGNQEALYDLYNQYARAIGTINGSNIKDWASKKTITKSVLNPKRTNESRVKDAFEGKDYKEGDKIYVFFKTKTNLELVENFDGEYCKDTLYKKLHATIKIFETLIPTSLFPNYSLKKNKELLDRLGSVELSL